MTPILDRPERLAALAFDLGCLAFRLSPTEAELVRAALAATLTGLMALLVRLTAFSARQYWLRLQ